MLTRQQLEALNPLPILEFQMEGWPAPVGIRRLGKLELAMFSKSVAQDGTPEDHAHNLGKFLALVVCDGDGNRLYSDDEYEQLLRLDFDVLHKLVKAAQEHNGINAEAVEDAKKNSDPTPN